MRQLEGRWHCVNNGCRVKFTIGYMMLTLTAVRVNIMLLNLILTPPMMNLTDCNRHYLQRYQIPIQEILDLPKSICQL